jgi:glycosyltransferase involved in cell wall biosynthesis
VKLIVVNALSALRGGGQTYILNFLRHFPEGDYEILLLVSSYNKGVFECCSTSRVKLYEATWASKSIIHRTLWECFYLPSFLTRKDVDVYYAPGGVMITKVPKGVVSVTALRNMLPFDERERGRFPLFSYVRFKLWILRYVFLQSYKISDKVVFISEYSKSIVKIYIPEIDKKSMVIPHGLNSLFLKSKCIYELPDNLKENQFYLYVSILDVYKAQKEIIKAWKVLMEGGFRYPLVLVGPKYNDYGEEVVSMIDELELHGKVVYLGKVDYEKLPDLYKSARVLIFASSCECCPNILLEKLSTGKPVICSDFQPMPEFGGDAVEYFNPYMPETLVNKVREIEEQQGMIDELSEKSTKQASKFDWNKTAKKTVKFLFD